MSKSSSAHYAAAPPARMPPPLTIEQLIKKLHERVETALATASATKGLFDTACVLEVDADAVMPLLAAGSTISSNQSQLLCDIANYLFGVEKYLAEMDA